MSSFIQVIIKVVRQKLLQFFQSKNYERARSRLTDGANDQIKNCSVYHFSYLFNLSLRNELRVEEKNRMVNVLFGQFTIVYLDKL